MVNAAATLLKKEILQPIAENLAFPLFAAVIYADFTPTETRSKTKNFLRYRSENYNIMHIESLRASTYSNNSL